MRADRAMLQRVEDLVKDPSKPFFRGSWSTWASCSTASPQSHGAQEESGQDERGPIPVLQGDHG
jgi:hypothetical protein